MKLTKIDEACYKRITEAESLDLLNKIKIALNTNDTEIEFLNNPIVVDEAEGLINLTLLEEINVNTEISFENEAYSLLKMGLDEAENIILEATKNNETYYFKLEL